MIRPGSTQPRSRAVLPLLRFFVPERVLAAGVAHPGARIAVDGGGVGEPEGSRDTGLAPRMGFDCPTGRRLTSELREHPRQHTNSASCTLT
ncbi:hypothetical protein IEU95_02885 [Hoyosella rhizosphaerae]|uniref:hypothetical protein n=1 Tax=Hoyosella rhizosphaerae TaxID=1755582 RepID=UPI00166B020A|nr:hypothetical protein [Hoyosella rhizosphaerae]MBN4925761.1 hypothetical protein [Hoyosella rhizosphaerae]